MAQRYLEEKEIRALMDADDFCGTLTWAYSSNDDLPALIDSLAHAVNHRSGTLKHIARNKSDSHIAGVIEYKVADR